MTGLGKRGFVLFVSVALLLSVTVIAAAFIFLVSARTRSAASLRGGSQALWLAEAGIQAVIARVMNDAAYAVSPTVLNGSLGAGSYAASVVKQAGAPVYTITSTGTAAGIARTVRQTATIISAGWMDAFTAYGAFTGGDISLEGSAKIYGDAYALGVVHTTTSSSVAGTVYADSGSGNYTRLPLPYPRVQEPALDATYYSALIATARTYAAKDRSYTTLNLAGGTVYVNGKVTVRNINGPGTVVSTGTFTVGKGTVGADVAIVSEGLVSFPQNSSIRANAVVYSSSGIFMGNANVQMTNATLLTPGSVDIYSSGKSSGVILAGNNVRLDQSFSMTGSVVAGGDILLGQSSRITHSVDQLPSKVPKGLATSVQVTLTAWQEL